MAQESRDYNQLLSFNKDMIRILDVHHRKTVLNRIDLTRFNNDFMTRYEELEGMGCTSDFVWGKKTLESFLTTCSLGTIKPPIQDLSVIAEYLSSYIKKEGISINADIFGELRSMIRSNTPKEVAIFIRQAYILGLLNQNYLRYVFESYRAITGYKVVNAVTLAGGFNGAVYCPNSHRLLKNLSFVKETQFLLKVRIVPAQTNGDKNVSAILKKAFDRDPYKMPFWEHMNLNGVYFVESVYKPFEERPLIAIPVPRGVSTCERYIRHGPEFFERIENSEMFPAEKINRVMRSFREISLEEAGILKV